MASSWVSTKVHVPMLRHGVVDRPRLRQRHATPGETRLTLLSAPAGFGRHQIWLLVKGFSPRHDLAPASESRQLVSVG